MRKEREKSPSWINNRWIGTTKFMYVSSTNRQTAEFGSSIVRNFSKRTLSAWIPRRMPTRRTCSWFGCGFRASGCTNWLCTDGVLVLDWLTGRADTEGIPDCLADAKNASGWDYWSVWYQVSNGGSCSFGAMGRKAWRVGGSSALSRNLKSTALIHKFDMIRSRWSSAVLTVSGLSWESTTWKGLSDIGEYWIPGTTADTEGEQCAVLRHLILAATSWSLVHGGGRGPGSGDLGMYKLLKYSATNRAGLDALFRIWLVDTLSDIRFRLSALSRPTFFFSRLCRFSSFSAEEKLYSD